MSCAEAVQLQLSETHHIEIENLGVVNVLARENLKLKT